MNSYRLTHHHYSCRDGVPVLMGADLTSGPHNRDATHESGSTYRDILLRVLDDKPLPDDPRIVPDNEEHRIADLFLYLYNGLPEEYFRYAESHHRLRAKGHKLPEVKPGPSSPLARQILGKVA